MLTDGEAAPEFRLPGTYEGEVREFALSEYVGDAVVVVCFYAAAFGPHTPPRDSWLRELDLLSLQRNVEVLGVGPDTAYSQREYARQASLDVPLLADTGGDVAEAFGVLDDLEDHRRVPHRSVFVLDDEGVVRHAWAAGDPTDRPDVDAVRDAIRSVKSDASALAHYRQAHDHYRYGESEFEIASRAYEDADWHLAVEAFEEAHRYLVDASEAAEDAEWFAESDALAADLAAAKGRMNDLCNAARWFAESARHYGAGDDARGDEFRRDAARQRERADDHDPLPDPGDLAGDG